MTTPERLRRRQRRESFFIALLALALAGSFFYDGYKREQQGQATQVQTCENANEARGAQLLLWTFILDASAQADPGERPPTKAEVDVREQLRDWLGKLFAPRDCSDLTKKYEIPPPPPLIQGPSDSPSN